LLEQFGLDESSKVLTTNGSKEEEAGDDELLEAEEAKPYRRGAATLNYLGQDCPDISFGTKEACRGMAVPTRGDYRRLKRVVRFVLGRKEVVWRYEWQEEGVGWKVYTDSDWAGCLKSRKSTSGGVLMRGNHCIRVWCSTQGALALSSAEAEYYSMVEGVLRAKGLQNVGREIGMLGMSEVVDLGVWKEKEEESVLNELLVCVDSSAAKAFVSKRGVGKMRHMEVKWLWLQEEVKKGRVRVEKVWGPWNPADLMTKFLSVVEIEDRLKRMCLEVRGVRGR